MLHDLRPERPETWGRDRPAGQWMHSGFGRENAGQEENLLTRAGLTPGRWDGPTTMRSYPMTAGDDGHVVLEVVDHQGVPVVESTLVFDSHQEYKWSERGGVNATVGPPKSHYALWDGIRHHLDLGAAGAVGPNAQPWIVMTAFVAPETPPGERRTFGWSLHEPGQWKSGPIAASVHHNGLYAAGKYSPTPVDNDQRNLPKSWSKRIVDLTPGEMTALIWEILVDPGGDGFLRVSRVHPDRVEVVAELGNQFGWRFRAGLKDEKGRELNNIFRVQPWKSYSYLRWPIVGDWLTTGVANWDGPRTKKNRFGRFVVASEGEITFDDAVEIARGELPGTQIPDPPPVDPGSGVVELRREVIALRAELAEITGQYVRLEDLFGRRWAAVAAAAGLDGRDNG